MKHSRLIITDSGGIQEEATAPAICKKVIVLRHSTERHEAVKAHFAELTNLKANDISGAIIKEWSKDKKPISSSPYGDGFSAKRIMNLLSKVK